MIATMTINSTSEKPPSFLFMYTIPFVYRHAPKRGDRFSHADPSAAVYHAGLPGRTRNRDRKPETVYQTPILYHGLSSSARHFMSVGEKTCKRDLFLRTMYSAKVAALPEPKNAKKKSPASVGPIRGFIT